MIITKHFLETYPLLRKLTVTFEKLRYIQPGIRGTSLTNLSKPPLNLYCKVCHNSQTFNMENDFEHFSVNVNKLNRSLESLTTVGKILEMRYLCASCNSYRYTYFLEFGVDKTPREDSQTFAGWVRKVGQSPPWEIDIDKNLEKVLGKDAELYKKGLVSESQSYGIGSYAYFRRTTENIIDELLDSISGLIDEKEKEQYIATLEKVKKTRITEDKIELVQHLLPTSLQPNGINPLKSLHSALSEGLHSKTDEECLELADTIKIILIYLLEEIRSRKDKAQEFTDKMKKLLEQK